MHCRQWSFIQNQIKFLMDTLILQLYFFMNKIINFQGDLTDIPAKKAPPIGMASPHRVFGNSVYVALPNSWDEHIITP